MHTRFHFLATCTTSFILSTVTCRAQFPNFTYGSNVGVHDLRMYVGPALDASQARGLAEGWRGHGDRDKHIASVLHTDKNRQADHDRH